ncbi:MAG: hypothetical protein QMC24_12730 [Akkermansiaceae bacterium]|jgi:hypothetical protein|tara:strand:+ start:222 stop:590 length:369 start_codon:yes stop_codon:yes gene_type:complete
MASTSDTSTTSIIKSDRIGRARYSSEYKAEVFVAYQKSGMSGPAFAQQCGIKYPTFACWIAKAKTQNSAPVTKPSEQSFFIAEIGNLSSREGLSVSLPGGASVQVTTPDEAQLLGILLKALA